MTGKRESWVFHWPAPLSLPLFFEGRRKMFGQLPARDPQLPLAVTADGRCWQAGYEVACEYVYPSGDLPSGDNTGPVTPPAYDRGLDRAACLAYAAKYRRLYGRDPDVWCLKPQPKSLAMCDYAPPPQGCRYVQGSSYDATTQCGLVLSCDAILKPSPTIPVQSIPVSPEYRVPSHRQRRPRVKIPKHEEELCPTRGWVTRNIAGANEYQVFRCDPGRPVVIDPGLQAVGRREALARRPGLGDIGDVMIGNFVIPTWALLAGAALIGVVVFKGFGGGSAGGRRRRS